MRYRVLEGGAIACSAVVFWGWLAAPEPGSQDLCQSPSPPNQPNPRSQQPGCHLQPQIQKAGILPGNLLNLSWGRDRSNDVTNELETIYAALLAQSQHLADRDRLPEAIAEVDGIPKNSQHFPLAQQLQNEWSQALLQQATQHYQQAQLGQALQLLGHIPVASQHFKQAKAFTQQWQQEAKLLKQAQQAQQAGHWSKVIGTLQRLEGSLLYQSSSVQTALQVATSRLYEPDRHLVEVASSTTEASSSLNIKVPNLSSSLSTVDSLPQSSQLDIETEQALAWAKPRNTPAIAQSTSPQPASNSPPSGSHRDSSTQPIFPYKLPQITARQPKPKPAIAPPETIPIDD